MRIDKGDIFDTRSGRIRVDGIFRTQDGIHYGISGVSRKFTKTVSAQWFHTAKKVLFLSPGRPFDQKNTHAT